MVRWESWQLNGSLLLWEHTIQWIRPLKMSALSLFYAGSSYEGGSCLVLSQFWDDLFLSVFLICMNSRFVHYCDWSLRLVTQMSDQRLTSGWSDSLVHRLIVRMECWSSYFRYKQKNKYLLDIQRVGQNRTYTASPPQQAQWMER